MEFTLTFIRGSFTQGGKEGRFIGCIDQPSHQDGIELLKNRARQRKYPVADAVFSSPLIRCTDSARAIYPYSEIIVLERLAAFDYGEFSGKSYSEIIADKQFAHWAKADQLAAFPGGEAPYAFFGRCGAALREIIDHARTKGLQKVSVITHKSVIEAILQRYSIPNSLYNDYNLDYGASLTAVCQIEPAALRVLGKI